MNKDKFIFTVSELVEAIDKRIEHCESNVNGYMNNDSMNAMKSAKEKLQKHVETIGVEEFADASLFTMIELDQMVKALLGENFCMLTALMSRINKNNA